MSSCRAVGKWGVLLEGDINSAGVIVVLQAVAQGRVWTGQRALEKKLVDVLGGLHEAVALVKQAAGIDQDEKVTLLEVSRSRTSPLSLIGGVTSMTMVAAHAMPVCCFSREYLRLLS